MFRPLLLAAVAAATLAGASLSAHAGDLLETYVARLGTDDHFNSNGKRLDNVPAIIRQDRANYHQFRIRDADDEGDSFFSSKENRAQLERMLRRGKISKAAQRAIINGTPLIFVEIYEDYINVDVQ